MTDTIIDNVHEVLVYPEVSRYIDVDIDPAFARDPFTQLAKLRQYGDIIRQEDGAFQGIRIPDNAMHGEAGRDVYVALGYDAARKVASDSKNFSSELGYGPVRQTFGEVLMVMDAPKHTQMKKLVLPSLAHRIVNEDLVRIAVPIINRALDAIADHGKGELISQFTSKFPFLIIANIFGVPEELAAEAEDLFLASMTMGLDPERAMAAVRGMDAMYQEVVDTHRRHPQDNMVATLLATEIDGVKLTDAEIVSFIKQIVAGGLDTTVRQAANLIYLLLDNPDQFSDLRENLDLLDNAIYEAMRVEATGGFVPRVAVNDVEVAGVTVPKGAGIYAVIHSANRDPGRWLDPDRFDIRRERRQNLTLGAGAHACLGANLTMAEQKIAMNGVLSRLKNLRKDPDRWDDAHLRGFQLRSPTKLPVLWDA